MIKRDMENPTRFAECIKTSLKMHDLQGLCKDDKNNYTMAVEAIYMGDDPVDVFLEAFGNEELYAKACLAKQLHIECVVVLHSEETVKDASGKYIKKDVIYVHYLEPDHVSKDILIVKTEKYNEASFVTWWKTKKYGKQTKPYRKEMGLRIKSSYFDDLLEKNSSSWSGNIDGFLIEDRGGRSEVSAIIECRFTSFEGISKYDPQKYFKAGGGDFKTWSELKQLADKLGVPLYLLTYSRILKDRNKVSAARVKSVNYTTGLTYETDKPGDKVFLSAIDLKSWMVSNGYR